MGDILYSKLTVPGLHEKDILKRHSLWSKMCQIYNFDISILTAGAGYGKTTAIAQFMLECDLVYSWYTIGVEDDTVYSFAKYLVSALEKFFPGIQARYIKQTKDERTIDWKNIFYYIMSSLESYADTEQKGILVLDDWQVIQDNTEIQVFFDRILTYMPKDIHIVIISREYVSTTYIEKLRMEGRVLDFYPNEFLFDISDMEKFFLMKQFTAIDANMVETIYKYTEGWIIIIKLLLNQLQENKNPLDIAGENWDTHYLFEYLSKTIFQKQSRDIQVFLMETSLVPYFDLTYCREVLGNNQAEYYIDICMKKGLFIFTAGEGIYRYHSLFQKFLQQYANKKIPEIKKLYEVIGRFYWQQGNREWALQFFLTCEDWHSIVKILSEVCRQWVFCGRRTLFYKYLTQIPVQYRENPQIYLALGDCKRAENNYPKAVYWYEKSLAIFTKKKDYEAMSQSYKALGEVYLDIIQPSSAQKYLKQAYRLLPPTNNVEKGTLLSLMSENMINHGSSRRAEKYLKLRRWVLPFDLTDEHNLQSRIYLRTGRIYQAIECLQKRYDSDSSSKSCSFRESSLILSLCYSLIGELETAQAYAKESVAYASRIHAPFMQVIGWVRIGHALLLNFKYTRDSCKQMYAQAEKVADTLQIQRGKTEIYWGQCLIQALEMRWEESQRIGLKAISLAESSKDNWFVAIMYNALGISASICQQYEKGRQYSLKALELFQQCRDTLGQAACYWQLTNQTYNLKDRNSFKLYYSELMRFCTEYNYSFLVSKKTLIGDFLGVGVADFLAYYTQIVQENQRSIEFYVLGGFEVVRNNKQIQPKEWHRKASKRLLQLLLIQQGRRVSKEWLIDLFWPNASLEVGRKNFKVIFNHLVTVLEPTRKARTKSSFILNTEEYVALISHERCWVDAWEFEKQVRQGEKIIDIDKKNGRKILQNALTLYKGEFLTGENDYGSIEQERSRLQVLAVQSATTLCQSYLHEAQYELVIKWADYILRIEPTWEQAYIFKIKAYGELHDEVQVTKIFRECEKKLKTHLQVQPSLQTRELYLHYMNNRGL